jgi:hypothetical protein
MKEEEWDAVIAINLKKVFNCSKAVIRYMGKQRGGKILVSLGGRANRKHWPGKLWGLKRGLLVLPKPSREFASWELWLMP